MILKDERDMPGVPPSGSGSRPSDGAAQGVSTADAASIPNALYLARRLREFEGSDELGNGDFSVCLRAADELEELQHEVWLSDETVMCVRDTAKKVTGGNCAFIDSDIGLLGRLAALALDAGLHAQMPELSRYTRHNFASAIEARRAETQGVSVADENAVPKGDAQ